MLYGKVRLHLRASNELQAADALQQGRTSRGVRDIQRLGPPTDEAPMEYWEKATKQIGHL